ncbi:MAG: hypothetical protein PHS60_02150 [Zavarzinia sp.]|jgi:hypothetical protein|nr:hypothetical protein [Zavarzinia sp.]
MASYKPVKSVSLHADTSGQDRRILDAANKKAADRDEPVGALVRRLLETALKIGRG